MAPEQQPLIDRHIERRPGQGFADARLKDYGVDVRALVMYYREAADGDPDVVASAYCLPREAIDAALVYYAQHRDVIDARILLNRDSAA
jgi:uncharacterized protein (DUF433 family)